MVPFLVWELQSVNSAAEFASPHSIQPHQVPYGVKAMGPIQQYQERFLALELLNQFLKTNFILK